MHGSDSRSASTTCMARSVVPDTSGLSLLSAISCKFAGNAGETEGTEFQWSTTSAGTLVVMCLAKQKIETQNKSATIPISVT